MGYIIEINYRPASFQIIDHYFLPLTKVIPAVLDRIESSVRIHTAGPPTENARKIAVKSMIQPAIIRIMPVRFKIFPFAGTARRNYFAFRGRSV